MGVLFVLLFESAGAFFVVARVVLFLDSTAQHTSAASVTAPASVAGIAENR